MPDSPAPANAPVARSRRRSLILALLALAAVGVAVVYFNSRDRISTDDAFIEAHVIAISPQISEHVNRVLVQDNQIVKKGDLLVELDPVNEQVLLDTARANLASTEAKLIEARAQLAANESALAQARADIEQAGANADNAAKELTRNTELRKTGAIAQRDFDSAQMQALSTRAALESKRQTAHSAESAINVGAAQVTAAEAQVAQAKSLVDAAQLRLSYTKITAPEAGRITRKSVEAGSYVQNRRHPSGGCATGGLGRREP